MAKNEELMEGILAAVEEADGPAGEQEGNEYGQDNRLGTIGEEADAQKEQTSAAGTVQNRGKP